MRIFGVKLCNCGLQVSFQNEYNSFLIFFPKKANFDQNKPVQKVNWNYGKRTTAKPKNTLLY